MPRQCLLNQKRLDLFNTHILQARAGVTSGAQSKIGAADLSILSHQHRAFDNMVQLADVSLPGIVYQCLHRRMVEPGDALAITTRMDAQEMICKYGYVMAAVA